MPSEVDSSFCSKGATGHRKRRTFDRRAEYCEVCAAENEDLIPRRKFTLEASSRRFQSPRANKLPPLPPWVQHFAKGLVSLRGAAFPYDLLSGAIRNRLADIVY